MTVSLLDPPWWMSREQWADEQLADRIRMTAESTGHSPATVSDVLGVLARHGRYSDEPDLANAARHCLRQNFEPADAILAALGWQRSKIPNVGDGFQVTFVLPTLRPTIGPDRSSGTPMVVNRYEPSPGLELWADHQRGEVGKVVHHRQVARGLEIFATITSHRRDLAAQAVAGRLGSSAGFRVEDVTFDADGVEVVGRAIVHEVSLVTGRVGPPAMPDALVRLAVYQPAPRRVVGAAERRRLLDEARRDGNRVREVGPDGYRNSPPTGRVLSVG